MSMNKELKNRLEEIKDQITKIENEELYYAGSEEFKDGYTEALKSEKEWLEGMIANFAE